jgi:nitric oxide reductase NorD protein
LDALNPITFEQLRADLNRLVPGMFADTKLLSDLACCYARFAAEEQHFFLRWIEVIAKSNHELAFLFAGRVPDAMARMGRAGVEAWLQAAMDAFDHRGLGAALEIINTLDAFVQNHAERVTGIALEGVEPILHNLLIGLSGRPLRIERGEDIYTDTESIFLAPVTNVFPQREDNARLIKLQAIFLWAQTWYGTFRVPIVDKLLAYEDRPLTIRTYQALEAKRLDRILEREFPGLRRDIELLDGLTRPEQPDRSWSVFSDSLGYPEASAEASLRMLPQAMQMELPASRCYHGQIRIERVHRVLSARVVREREQFRYAVGKLRQATTEDLRDDHQSNVAPGRQVSFSDGVGRDSKSHVSLMIRINDRILRLPNDARGILASITQDFGAVPDEHLISGGEGEYHLEGSRPVADIATHYAIDHDELVTHPEWDYTRNCFRNGYCTVRELDITPVDDGFTAQTRVKFRGALHSIRRTFEAMRGDMKMERRQLQGDEVDLDALIEAYADYHAGQDMDERVFMRMDRNERNIAVMFMVDMSGSTKGWVNRAERESLVLLCEALETLGDSYAIYGFSGRTHKRCEIYRIKRFEDHYDETVQGRISAIAPKTYTRMGVAIRHLSVLLNRVPARTKLLIALSDGKPEDYGGYRGRYGVEDTRHALLETRRNGIHPFCITIDKEAGVYLPHMYGPANYAIIDQVHQLPLKVADIYRRLTT